MTKLRVQEVIVVEGKYDAAALASVVDGLILTTGGFSIFTDEEKKALLKTLAKQRGLVILTDSDAAGFRIRNYIEKIAKGAVIKNAYIPAVAGKESRKPTASKEGTLGVEGMPPLLLKAALENAGVRAGEAPAKKGREITYTDLYELGISGGQGSAGHRRELLARLGLPLRLSKRALCQVLNSLYTYDEFVAATGKKAALFWDFHGTLTLPDVTWFAAAMEAAKEKAPEMPLDIEVLTEHFGGTCLPWFSVPSRDTRHLVPPGAWWGHCEKEFVAMFMRCGFTRAQAEKIAPVIRKKTLQPERYTLYPDAAATLRELQKRGYQNYILSNNFPEMEEITTALGLAPYINGVFVSGKIGFDKPRREIFEHARQAVGGGQTPWMIGDNPEDDIVGGKAAGFVTVAVHGITSPSADFRIDELEEILELLP